MQFGLLPRARVALAALRALASIPMPSLLKADRVDPKKLKPVPPKRKGYPIEQARHASRYGGYPPDKASRPRPEPTPALTPRERFYRLTAAFVSMYSDADVRAAERSLRGGALPTFGS